MKLHEVMGQGQAKAGEQVWQQHAAGQNDKWTIVLPNGNTHGSFDNMDQAITFKKQKGVVGKVRPMSEVRKTTAMARR